MSPDTIEAVRCALMTVCETGGTMDELALIEQADMISKLTLELAALKEKARAAVNAPYDDVLDMGLRQALKELEEALPPQ